MSRDWALLPLRVTIGFGFAAHGYAKLSRGTDSFAAILGAMGVPQAHLMAWATPVCELVGGIAVMAGAFVVPLSVPLALIMLGAMFGVHARYGYSSVRLLALTPAGARFGPVGYEINVLYVAGLLALALSGAGRLSVDHLLASAARARRGESTGRGKAAG